MPGPVRLLFIFHTAYLHDPTFALLIHIYGTTGAQSAIRIRQGFTVTAYTIEVFSVCILLDSAAFHVR